MLFVTTRSKVDSFTAFYTLSHSCTADGGYFVPLQLPYVSKPELNAIIQNSFGQCVADILNLFFRKKLTGWDVDFCIGRQAVRLVSLGQKVYIAECWHNPDRSFAHMVRNLSSRIKENAQHSQPTYWATMSVRIAILFAAYGQLRKQGELAENQLLDISVDAGDFSEAMAAWYARKMGLPIGNIICACRDSSKLWDFFRSGTLSFASENVDAQYGLEPLIYACFGREEVKRFLHKSFSNGVYTLQDRQRKQISADFRACVIGSKRIHTIIHSVCATTDYFMNTQCASAFAGVQDSRISEGESRVTLLLSQKPNERKKA